MKLIVNSTLYFRFAFYESNLAEGQQDRIEQPALH